MAAWCQNAYFRSFLGRQRHASLHCFGEVDPIPFYDAFLDYLVVFDADWLQYLYLDFVAPLNFAHGVCSNSFSGGVYWGEVLKLLGIWRGIAPAAVELGKEALPTLSR
jgi:hypothetical protein